MTETEMRPDVLRDRLDHAFADEPPLVSIAAYEAAGRQRLRRRRSTLAAGCVLAAIMVPVGAATVIDRTGGDEQLPLTTSEPRIPDDWRTERGAGVAFSVPGDWGSGNPSQWCSRSDGSPPPLVFIQGEMVTSAMACVSPSYWYGVTLRLPDAKGPALTERVTQYEPPAGLNQYELPPGSWGVQADAPNGWVLSVVAPTREIAELIVSSLRNDSGA